jgi:hypothetical protein
MIPEARILCHSAGLQISMEEIPKLSPDKPSFLITIEA